MKSGYRTTELYVTLATLALGAVALVHPGFKAPPGLAQALAAGAPGVVGSTYALGRSLLKVAAVSKGATAVVAPPVVNITADAPAPVTAKEIAEEIIKSLSPPPAA